jgi:hypothetical protein
MRVRALTELEPPASPDKPDTDGSSDSSRSSFTPVYEKPDGWSKVVCQLPDHATVTICGTEGNFLKVTTANRVVGYISQAARDRVIVTPAN